MDYQDKIGQIKEIILPLLEAEGLELVEISCAGTPGETVLKLLVDRQYGGITIQECAGINSKLTQLFLQQLPLGEYYSLEVSSPGLDRPLKTKNDFLRSRGRQVRILLRQKILDKGEHIGMVKDADEQKAIVEIGSQDVEIPYGLILKATQYI